LSAEMGIPPLSHFGVAESDIPAMVELAQRSSSMKYNPVALDDAALSGVLADAIGHPRDDARG